jgi:hypothetical protein
MKYFSLDTNFVLALVNDKDRLSKTAYTIIKKEKKDCALCISVLKESRKVVQEKINRAVVNSLEIIIDIKDITDPTKREKDLKKRFHSLIKKDVQLKNFYLFLQDKILAYIKTIGLQTLPRYLSNLSEHVARTLEPELKKIITYSYIKINFSDSDITDRLSKIKTCSSSVHFKDNMDYQIFCEIVLNLSTNFMIDFYTDDKEFSKKGRDELSEKLSSESRPDEEKT